jgi:hypothetical protein
LKEYLEKIARDGLERCAEQLCDSLRGRYVLEVVVALLGRRSAWTLRLAKQI